MALIKCKECKERVSNKALSCPHCGNPINVVASGEDPDYLNWLLPMLLLGFLVLGILLYMM